VSPGEIPWGDLLVAVGSTSPQAREHRLIDNYLKGRTRGFAVQIILDGRGVKACFPTEYCLRDPDCIVSVNKAGLIVVHGPTKERVGVVAHRLMKKNATETDAVHREGRSLRLL